MLKPVSVIIVNYNSGDALADCVRSVLLSSVPVEILISDNGSCDNSLWLVREDICFNDSNIHIIENRENLGFAKANNIVLPRVQGDYFLFLNPDCIIEPDTLKGMISAMEQHPEAGLAGCLICNPDGTEQAGCRRYVPTPWRSFVRTFNLSRVFKSHPRFRSFLMTGQPLPDAPCPVEAISGAFMFVRRRALEQTGPLDDKYFMHCEDLDWCMRFRQAGWKVLFVPDVTVVHLKGVCSRAEPIAVEWHKHRGMIRFYNKFFRQHYPGVLMWLVVMAVWMRFAAKASVLSVHQLRGRKYMLNSPLANSGAEPVHDGAVLSLRPLVMVTGATSQIGHFLLPRLVNAGFAVHAVSRQAKPQESGSGVITWSCCDIAQGLPALNHEVTCLVHLAPLWLLPEIIAPLAERGLKRVIAFSSTSVFTKQQSTSAKEIALVERLRNAEEALFQACDRHGIAWTIFRPTLIYGCGLDRNITTIARFVGRFGFFPVVGSARGLRQPVHADDLAASCVASLECPSTYNQTYNLSGGETLSYREMVEDVFLASGKKPRVLNIPLPVFRVLIGGLSLLPRYRFVTSEMADRMNQDMCFDHSDAASDFGYCPREFRGGTRRVSD